MEIERKYLVRTLPEDLASRRCLHIEQAYICTSPVIRIRRENDTWYLTCKGQGMLSREECNLPMTRETYEHLLTKVEGTVLTKDRYLIPLSDGLCAFENMTPQAERFVPPAWFGEDVTFDPRYHNSWMSRHTPTE